MRKLFIASLILGITLVPTSVFGRNKKNNNNNEKKEVAPVAVANPFVVISNPPKQLHGEWTILSIRKKNITGQQRAFINFDFPNEKKLKGDEKWLKGDVYGNNGSNVINGNFSYTNNTITFKKMSQGNTKNAEKNVMDVLNLNNDKKDSITYTIEITNSNNMDYMTFKDKKGNEVMKTRRLNFDYIEGAWRLDSIGNKDMKDHNIRMVIDIEMRTINVVTKCNIINGVVNIDAQKEREVQFEDLVQTHYTCSDIDAETEILINLEEVISCRKIDDNKVVLLGPKQQDPRTMEWKDQKLIVLSRLNLKKD